MAEPPNQENSIADRGEPGNPYALRVDIYDIYDETVSPFRKSYTIYPDSKSRPKPSHAITVTASLLTVWSEDALYCIFVRHDYDKVLPEHDEHVRVFKMKGPSIVIEYTHGDVGKYHFSVSPRKEEPPVEYDEFEMWYDIEKEKWELKYPEESE